MKLNEVTKTGFYTADNQRMVVYEVLENTDDTLLDEPLLVDEWTYEYTDDNGIRYYEADGYVRKVQNYADDIEVEEITDTSYIIYGNSGALMRENKSTYKEKFNTLLKGDKETIISLKRVLPMIEFNKVAYDYLDKIIKDFEKGLKDVEKD